MNDDCTKDDWADNIFSHNRRCLIDNNDELTDHEISDHGSEDHRSVNNDLTTKNWTDDNLGSRNSQFQPNPLRWPYVSYKSPWGHIGAHLPIELCEMVIDWVAEEGLDRPVLQALVACARVCRVWTSRARFHVHRSFTCRDASLYICLEDEGKAENCKPFLLRGYVPPLPHFLVATSRIPGLKSLDLRHLDLSNEHPTLSKIVPSLITKLCLRDCETRSVAQLGRFITSFPFLTYLEMTWSLPPPNLLDCRIRRNKSKSSLATLEINMIPGIHGLLDYFIQARPFVIRLQSLTLEWTYVENVERHASLLSRVRELFIHSRYFLRILNICISGVSTDKFPDNLSELIPLLCLPQLDSLHYGSRDMGPVAAFALQHLESIPVENRISRISIHQTVDFGKEASLLDDLLSGRQFRSLRQLGVRTGHGDLFPQIKARGVEITESI